jgi:hypothetical protein
VLSSAVIGPSVPVSLWGKGSQHWGYETYGSSTDSYGDPP